jgi:hypothetical protein
MEGFRTHRPHRAMFTKAQYEEVAMILHESYIKLAAYDKFYHIFWYEHVYMPFVRKFEEDNERFDSVTFSFAVATGKLPGRKLKGMAREGVEQVTTPA